MRTSPPARRTFAIVKPALAAETPRTRSASIGVLAAREVRPDIALFDAFDAIRNPLVDVKLAFFEPAALFGQSALLLADTGLEILKPVFHSLLHELRLGPNDLFNLLFNLGLFCRVIFRRAIGIAQFMQPLLILELLNDRIGKLRSPFLELEILHRHRRHPADQSLEAPRISIFQRCQAVVAFGELLANEFHDPVDHFRRERTVHGPSFAAAPTIAPAPARALPAKTPTLPFAGPIKLLTRSVSVAFRRLGANELSIADRKHRSEDQS